ncbi:MAG: DEAD/DEAH box helicase [Bacteroidales bacterium]|nr:DEAD/DEAH box helicase [Bacteroidales bacterium]
MEQIINKWLQESEKFEFCKSYGVDNMPEVEFVERQEDFYISLLGILHDKFVLYIEKEGFDEHLKHDLFQIVKGLLVYSQKETYNSFHGVRTLNNQLYVASIYYLCDYPAISTWTMSNVSIADYNEQSSQLLSFIVTGGKSYYYIEEQYRYQPVVDLIKRYIETGDEQFLSKQIDIIEEKYKERNFESSTDFYMTTVLRCVLHKFKRNNIWKSLLSINPYFDWNDYVRYSYNQHFLSFLPSQQDAIDKGLLVFEGAFSLKMPTSAGKSYITELLIYHELRSNQNAKVLYLAPLRALSRELKDRFRKIHKQLGFSYATKYGGNASAVNEEELSNAQLLISTPESFMGIESSDDEILNSFTLIICDEGQLLDDYSRGINYEMLLTRLRRQENVRFLFISAVIPNIEVINRWLNGTDDHIGNSMYRPSNLLLTEALVNDKSIDLNIFNESYSNVYYNIPSFITQAESMDKELRHKVKGVWKLWGKPVGCFLALKSLKAGSVLLFSTAKSTGLSCIGLTKYMIEILSENPFDSPTKYVKDKTKLNKIIEYANYQLGNKHLLCNALRFGFAYHHGDIPQDLREKIERAYDEGLFRLIIGNTTLAEGVNMPIKTIVLANVYDQSNQGKFLTSNRLKNIIGRVGRAGRERYGTITVPVAYRNGMLIKLLKQALNPNDNELEKIKGTLYDLVATLVNRQFLDSDNDINQLLSIATFTDAIDEMILRSSVSNSNLIDVDKIVTNSLAYVLSDDMHREVLNRVFKVRHDVLKNNLGKEKTNLMMMSGLNARDFVHLEELIKEDFVSSLNNIKNEHDFYSVTSIMIETIMNMPSIKDQLEHGSNKNMKLFNDIHRLVEVANHWMNGCQYYEISTLFNLDVDTVIELIKYIQSVIHDKSICIIAYIKAVYGLTNSIVIYFPDYLRLGINTRLMYELHKIRIPERIQLHALDRFFNDKKIVIIDYASLKNMLIVNREAIVLYMNQNNYPQLSIEGFVDIINYYTRN